MFVDKMCVYVKDFVVICIVKHTVFVSWYF